MNKNKFNLRNVVAIAICLVDFSFGDVLAQDSIIDEGVIINGIIWAKSNVNSVGAFSDSPERTGGFYQWDSKSNKCTTNCISFSTSWNEENDPCPTGWRVPTLTELESLGDGAWIEKNGVSGCQFGSGSNVIFLPAAGCYLPRFAYPYSFQDGGKCGYYWSSTKCDDNSDYAYRLCFQNGYTSKGSYGSHGMGQCVRCVKHNSNSSINEVEVGAENLIVIGYFDILGRKLKEEPTKGIYIILYDSGKTKKMMK